LRFPDQEELAMLKRLLLPAAAALFGAAALFSAPANATWAAAPAAVTHSQAQNVSDVIEVRDRHRRHGHRHHRHWHPYAFAPYYGSYAYYPRRCGYVWSPRHYRHVYRCW
jgi:hypothetical protein